MLFQTNKSKRQEPGDGSAGKASALKPDDQSSNLRVYTMERENQLLEGSLTFTCAIVHACVCAHKDKIVKTGSLSAALADLELTL